MEAERELLDGPAGLVRRVLELRAYKSKFDQLMNPDPKREVVYDDLFEMVEEIHAEVQANERGQNGPATIPD